MADKLQMAVTQLEGATSIKLTGVLDEDNRLGEIVGRVGAGRAVIHLGDVERLNSCGIRDWVNWLGSLESRGIQPVFVECSPAIVAQLNLVKNFCGGGIVKSFYVPYYCPECDEEKMLLLDVAELGPPPHEPPTCRCDECEALMNFDDMADSYFAFLSARHRESAKNLPSDNPRGSSSSIKTRSRTSQPLLAKRASTPSLSAFQKKSSPSIAAGSKPSAPRLAADPQEEAVISVVQARPQHPSSGLAVKLLIGALLLAVAALAYILVAL